MRTRAKIVAALIGLSLLSSSCVGGGYDLQRYKDDRLHFAMASALATNWFEGKPVGQSAKEDVEKSLSAWSIRLDSDAKVLGVGK